MKKLAALLMIGVMVCSMTACGQKPAETQTAESTAVEGTTAATEAAATESANADNRLAKIKEAGVLKVATSPDYPPYEFEDITKDGQDKYVGADITFAKKLAEGLGVELQIDAMAFDAALAAVAEGKDDIVIAGMVPKEERKTSMDFTDVYYNDGDQVLVVLKEEAGDFKALKDLAGKSVAAQNGTLQAQLVTEQLPDSKMEMISTIPDAVMMLKTGKVDAIALASVAADNYVKNYPELVVMDEKFQYEALGVVAGVVKDEPELLDAVNAIVKEVVDSGDYNQWIEDASNLSNEIQGQ